MNRSSTPSPSAAPPGSVITQLFTAAHEVQAHLEARLAAVGLSAAKARVLWILARAKQPLPLSSLAQCAGCMRSNVTQLIDRLEADGLVRRMDDPRDRRIRRATLTPEGRRAYREALSLFRAQERAVVGALGGAGSSALVRLLRRLSPAREPRGASPEV
jgi:DNA-binding MarR family transcriptional regulator